MKAMSALVLILPAFLLGGCNLVDQAIEKRAEAKLEAWEAANPSAKPTASDLQKMWDEAKAEVYKEAAEKGAGAVTSIASGNWLALIFHGIGLAGIALGATGKWKAAAKEAGLVTPKEPKV